MNARRLFSLVLALTALVVAPPAPIQAADAELFYKACYLQTEERDFAAAAKLFAAVEEQGDATPEIRAAARQRLAECREEMAAADLATLMPPDSLVYVQVANVGAQATAILKSLGVSGDGDEADAATERIPIEPGLSIPIDFVVSPALVREIAKLGGVAAAMTGLDERSIPEGVVVVHLGGSDLVRGIVETGLEIVTPSDAVGGYDTFRIPIEGESLWLVKTARLLVFSNSREQVAAAVGRLDGADAAARLSDSESFRAAAANRGDSFVFAWVDSQRAAPMVDALMQQEMRGQELMAARTVLNLQQIECATFALGATDDGLQADAAIRFKPGHQHLIYGLIRTAPIGEDALQHVPADAAAVAAIGLNPPTGGVEGETGSTAPPQIALMDIGRELFANVRSITAFVVPGETQIPDVGVVVCAQDGEKSKQLWTQLMGLPARFGLTPAEAVREVEIGGHSATQYAYPEAPPIFVTQPSGNALVIGTAGAVEASLAALDESQSLAKHPGGAKLLQSAGPATSKAIFLRGAQLLKCVEPAMGQREREKLAAIAPVVDDLTAALTVDEEPNELHVRIELAGVPRVGDVLRVVAGARSQSPGPRELPEATAP